MACIYGVEQPCNECRMCASVNSKVASGHNMVRLTIKAPSGLIHLKDNKEATINTAIKKLSDYEDLEAQGKLLKLPCAVGDTVWDNDFGRLCSYEVTGFSFGNLNDDDWEEEKVLDKIVVYYTNSNGSITGTFAVSEIGKTVFLTKSAAAEIEIGGHEEKWI